MIRLAISVFLLPLIIAHPSTKPSFTIDYPNNQFLKDGQPFRYVSGSLHYFRVPRVLWRDRMLKMRAAGVNALMTVIEWSLHEPERKQYDFTGENDIVEFFKTAQEVGLLVLTRPGPFIDAERDFGGFPYWLLRDHPNLVYRSSDSVYLKEVEAWFSVLLPKLEPLLYKNGGPIIMVQSENEYGSFGCDFKYTAWLRDLLYHHLGRDVVLFTNDGVADKYLKCGKVDGVLATLDMDSRADPNKEFAILRRHQEFGPICLSEFYPGRLDTWERNHSTVATDVFCKGLDNVLKLNVSVNIYMFHGGTSFGMTSGSLDNVGPSKRFYPMVTSYDHDSPLTEAGDPTDKYFAIRNVIKKYLPLPKIPVPSPAPKMELNVTIKPVASIFDFSDKLETIESEYPMTFEQLNHPQGFILYSTTIKDDPSDPAVLSIPGLHDRAQVFVDRVFQGTMSRTRKVYQLAISTKRGSKLDIFVEHQGRICYGKLNEMKGIVSNVTLGPDVLTWWSHRLYFKNWNKVIDNFKTTVKQNGKSTQNNFFQSKFVLPNSTDYPLDTFLRLDGWRKGLAFLNGFNLGRYWPVAGPQVTLYVPKHLFKLYPQTNHLVLFELESSPCDNKTECEVRFVKQHVVNGTVPYNGNMI